MKDRKYKSKLAIILLSVFALGTLLFSFNFTSAKYVINSYYTVAFSASNTFNVTSIGPITGTQRVTQDLTAGTLTPTSAASTASYQWYSCATANGTYSPISGATSSAYTLTPSDLNCYIEVTATGTENYTGSVTSAYVGPILAPPTTPLTSIGATTGTAQVSSTLISGAVTPSGATYAYQWQRSSDNISFSDISGATLSTYTLVSADYNRYIRTSAIGSASYSGTVYSAGVGPVAAIAVTAVAAPTTPSGNYYSGNILTCGATTPASASVTYQWQRSTNATSGFTNISGATLSTYTISTSDNGYYIWVVVTGNTANGYTGTATSTSVGPIKTQLTAVGAISGTAQINQILTAGALTPSAATATYQWYRASTLTGTWNAISGAISASYTAVTTDCNFYLKVVATGTGNYIGTVEAVDSSAVSRIPISAVTITGDTADAAAKYSTLTATVTPSDAVVNYQWYVSSTNSNTAGSAISGATSSTFKVPASTTYYGKYVYVTVTVSSPTSLYTGSASSTCVSIGATTKSGLTSVTTTYTTPLRITRVITGKAYTNTTQATTGLTYKWQNSTDGITYTNISTATSSTYTLQTTDNHKWVRLMVTGSGATYVGTVYSTPLGLNTIYLGSYSPYVSTALASTVSLITSGTGSTSVSSYKWQKCLAYSGTFTDISGATSSSYTPQTSDIGYYLRVAATLADGTTIYDKTTDPVQPAILAITAVTISPTNVVSTGVVVTATTTPADASVTYVWAVRLSTSTTWTQTSTDLFSHTVTDNEWDNYNYIHVVVTSNSPAYTGSATSSDIPLW